MKQFISFLICLTFLVNSYSQTSKPTQLFIINKIGLSFYQPSAFKFVDSTAFDISPNSEFKVWRQGYKFKADSGSLILSISTSTQKGIDWPNIYKKEANHFYEQVITQNSETTFDSSSTTISIDSKTFNKFSIIGKKNGVITYNHVQLSAFIKGYKVNIAYNYNAPEIATQIDMALATVKFTD